MFQALPHLQREAETDYSITPVSAATSLLHLRVTAHSGIITIGTVAVNGRLARALVEQKKPPAYVLRQLFSMLLLAGQTFASVLMHLAHSTFCRRRPCSHRVTFWRLTLKVRRVECIDLGTFRPKRVLLPQ